MVNETGQVKPTNRIVVDNQNIHIQTKKVETATTMYAGRLVKAGTNDDDVVVASGSNTGYAWLGYEQTTKKYRPATVDTIYAQNDQVTVFNGPGVILVAALAPGVTATKGTLLTGAADGTLTGGTAGTHDIVATAEQAVTSGAAVADCMVRSRI
jgi:hypothetical protein